MRLIGKLAIVFLMLGATGFFGYEPALRYWKLRNRPEYRVAEVSRGRIVSTVNSTGTVQPVITYNVGSFVSGPIIDLKVDFNERVEQDQVLAEIDPLIYKANVDRDLAVMATREADVARVEAQLQLAKNDEARSRLLRDENPEFISDAEMDQFKFARMSLEAQLLVAKASVDQARGSLENSEANLGYTKIRAPVEGIVIDRKIEPGQTLAAQFQTPELFTIAVDMDKRMHVFASVDEADIGLIRSAQDRRQPVSFTVDAYPDDLFTGEIEQIRISSTTTQNVVTYPVVVTAPNPDLKLLPGMTTSLSFQVEEKKDVLRIPNAALRFYPDVRQVREQDKHLLEGSDREQDESSEESLSAEHRAELAMARNRRHVWVEEDSELRAIAVVTGIMDGRYTQLISGDLQEGQKLVTGIQPKKP
jgi:HlyD family secretion protein